MYSLSPQDESILRKLLSHYVGQCEIRVFGSRHKGNAKSYSDMDIALVGEVEATTLIALREALQDSDLTVRVDVLVWSQISDSFKDVIAADYSVLEL